MLLAIDIGNSNIVLGVNHQEKWQRQWRIQTNVKRMDDEYAVLFTQLFQQSNIRYTDFDQIVISSVVPQLTTMLATLLQQQTDIQPIIVNYAEQDYLQVCTHPPDKTGSDLIANGIAAYQYFQANCLVVDFGTATTISAIAEPGKFLGCSIAPGLHATIDTLVERTSQLPQIAIEAPATVIGNNTVHSMQAGLILGHLCMVEGLIQRMRAELNDPTAKVVATGGLATTLAPFTKIFDHIDEWLTLDGLNWIAKQ